jgi:hypothetical protein
MDKDNIFTMASVKGASVSADDLATAEEALAGAEVSEAVYERVRRAVRKTLREDIGKVWMDYGHYGSDTDAPPDHDTSSWSPLDDVEDDAREVLSAPYVSRNRTVEAKLRLRIRAIMKESNHRSRKS